MSLLYVYAVSDGAPASGCGMLGEPLLPVTIDGVTVIVGEHDDTPAIGATELAAHDRVVRAMSAALASVLPARFGLVYPDALALSAAVQTQHAAIRAALGVVRGREQMTLRLFRSAAQAVSIAAGTPPGTRYLAERRAAAHEGSAVLAELRRQLHEWVRAERVVVHPSAPLVASVYHLIDRGAAPAYVTALGRVDHGEVKLSGPWPAYAFAALS